MLKLSKYPICTKLEVTSFCAFLPKVLNMDNFKYSAYFVLVDPNHPYGIGYYNEDKKTHG